MGKFTTIKEWASALDQKEKNLPMRNIELLLAVMMGDQTEMNSKIETMLEEVTETKTLAHGESIGWFRFKYINEGLKTNIKIEPTAWLLALENIPDIRPGNQVELAWYLYWKATDLGVDTITPNTITKKIFPFGGFNEEVLHEVWDGQKTDEGLNMLDNIKYWE